MTISTIEQLEAIYGTPKQASIIKVADHVKPQFRAIIEASPFAALATALSEGEAGGEAYDRALPARMRTTVW